MLRRLQLGLLLTAALALIAVPASAQLTHKGPAVAIDLSKTVAPFDVVSVKQNNSQAQTCGIDSSNGAITATNVPLRFLIEFAYDVKENMITGLSGPVATASFDLEGKIVPPDGGPLPKLTDTQAQAMLILALQDRFHLKAHLESKVMPVYDLVPTKGGLKIKLSQDEIKNSSWNINGEDTSKVLTSNASSMADLAAALSDEVGRQVIDKTGLPGRADITLKWTDDVAAQQGGSDVISIFTALEEQLGLKLQPSKGPVPILVIDHAEMPTPD